MSTLVTCGTGFVSRAFIRVLKAVGAPVHTLVRDHSRAGPGLADRVIVGDLFDPLTLRRAVEGAKTVIHVPPLAPSAGNEQSAFAAQRRVHVESTQLLLEQAAGVGVQRFLFVSSAHATGRSSDRAMCELAGEDPTTAYARAKREAEHVVLAYAERLGLEAVILRPPGIYGPGDKSIVSPLRRAAMHGLPLPLKGIRASHSLVYVDDLARAGLALLDRASETTGPRTFIVKDPVDYAPADLYRAVGSGMGRPVRTFFMPPGVLRMVGRMGVAFRHIPWIRSLAVFRTLLTSQRYCDHLLRETLPGFTFVGVSEAMRRILSAEFPRFSSSLTTVGR